MDAPRTPLLRGLLAGAVAGLLTGLVAVLVAEPTLDAAIAREPAGDGELFSRVVQKGGLVLGLVLVGLALGALFSLAYRQLPADLSAGPWQRSLTLALGGFTAFFLIPFLRYPANPPGVGDESTLGDRTSAYLLAVAVGLAVTTAAYAGSRALGRRGLPAWQRQPVVALAAGLVLALAYVLLPDPAPVEGVPVDLVWDFRLRSLGIQALLYAVLGAVFGMLGERAARRQAAAVAVPV